MRCQYIYVTIIRDVCVISRSQKVMTYKMPNKDL